ncbi:MAG: lamin tail domain-containing protein [Pirellulales bacterium]
MSRRATSSARRRRSLCAGERLEPRLALTVGQAFVTELSAANNTTLADQDGDYGDWIELYNADAEPLDLSGWKLSDDPAQAGQWTFPIGTTIAPAAFLVVFASGKNRAASGAELHTDFSLDADGEVAVLFDAAGEIAAALPFPLQHTAASYGVTFTAGQPDTIERRFYFDPSPGAMNAGGVLGFAAEPWFAQPHGFYETAQAFQLGINTLTPGASIYYTTDGTAPTSDNPATTLYNAATPPLVNRTTTVRAAASLDGYVDSPIATSTYIFLDDVLTQSPSGQPPAGWPATPVGPNGQRFNYGMDPDIVNDPVWGPQLKAALTAIPSFSIVTDADNLFDSTTGIYVNAQQHGEAWERPTSVELIYPDGQSGFQADAGLRIRGGFSRTPSNPKHAFRLFFRAEYGDTKLHYPLFGDEGADEFDTFDLRTDQNDSWAYQRSREMTMIHDVFSRDTQAAMGQPYTRSQFYHLYINGVYWGLYQTQERPEASYGETYFGGDKDDYDVIKSTGSPLYQTEATDGNFDAWQTMWQMARSVRTDPTAYYRLQGLNPDGTRNPAYPVLLDVDNLIDYMTIIFYTGDEDASLSVPFGNNRSNNWYAMRNRVGDEGFRFFIHDAEQTLFSNHNIGDLSVDRTGPFIDPNQNLLAYSNPQWVHQDLMAHEEYRLRFADRVQLHLSPGGALTEQAILARWNERAAQVELPIIAESARWGDAQREPPFTQTDWAYAVQNVAQRFFAARQRIFLDQLKNDLRENPAMPGNLIPGTLYPSVAAPQFSQHGGQVAAGTPIALATPPDESYTDTTLLPTTAAKRALIPTNDTLGTTWTQASFSDAAWQSGTSGVGYELQPASADSVASLIGTNVSAMYTNYSSVFVRTEFTIAAGQQFDELWLRMKYNDGFIAYLDGIEVIRSGNTPAGNPVVEFAGHRDDKLTKAFEEHDISHVLASLAPGTHVLAIHGYNESRYSTRMLVLPELIGRQVATSPAASTIYYTTDGSDPRLSGGAISPTAIAYSGEFPIAATGPIKSRALLDGQWSALSTASFSVASPIRISEVMYHPTAQTAAELAGSAGGATVYDKDEYEFIELFNAGTSSISLAGLRLDDGVRITLAEATLAPGQHAVVVRNTDAFVNRYGSGPRIVGDYGTLPENDRLSNAGERIALVDSAGFTILDFTYDDVAPWPMSPDGLGRSLVIVDAFAGPPTWASASAWRASYEFGGSPREVDAIAGDLDADDIVGLRDLILLQNNLGISNGATRSTGDLTGDGAVTIADVAAFAKNYGRTAASTPPAASSAASVIAIASPRPAA